MYFTRSMTIIVLIMSINAVAQEVESPVLPSAVEKTSKEASSRAAGDKAGFAGNENQKPNSRNPATRRFPVWEFRVSGNTVLSSRDIERSTYPHLGPNRSADDVDKARAALEQLYRERGFPTVLVSVPEQDVRNGVVRLQVTEGKVRRLRVRGAQYHSPRAVRRQVPALAKGAVPYLPEVRRQIAEVNRATPDRRVTPILRPGRTPGALEVELKVQDELPLHGSIEVTGRNTASTSRTRLNASLRYDNFWQRQHSAALQYQTAPEDTDEVQVAALTYAMPIGAGRGRLVLYGIHSESDIAAAGDITVIGQGDILGLSAVLPLDGSDNYFHAVAMGADYKDFDEAVTLGTAGGFETPISYAPLSVRYDATYRGERSWTKFVVGTVFALRGLGADDAEFVAKRQLAKSNFLHLNVNFKHTHEFTNGMRLLARVAGQLADSPLISNEQFSAGGAESVRGYHEAEVLGDDGISGSIEWQTPRLFKGVSAMDDFRFTVFADGAHVRVQDPLPGERGHFTLAGAGVGHRFRYWKNLHGSVAVAWPFEPQGRVERGDSRVHFVLGYEF